MQCISPLRLKKRDSFGNNYFQDVPCGRCNFCLKRRRDSMTFRLIQEERNSFSAYFVTMTYAEDQIIGTDLDIEGSNLTLGVLYKKHCQDFLKRLRAFESRKGIRAMAKSRSLKRTTLKSQIRYYLVGEYGSKSFRPHYHMIIFNLSPAGRDNLEKIWSHGSVHVGSCGQASIKYTLKYMYKQQDEKFQYLPKELRPFALMSKGIGKQYITEEKKKYHKNVNYVSNGRIKQGMPRYYSDILYNNHEKHIANEKLKKEREEKYEEFLRKSTHPDPHRYHEEMIRKEHENLIKTKNGKL